MRQIDVVKIYAKKRCLVIDDMSEIRGSIVRMLRVFGVPETDTAANGEEAVELCRAKNYDIVLCDYNLGAGKDGQQVLEELRYLNLLKHTCLFVMITAESSSEMVLGALECQPDDYLTKPITQALLRDRLDKALILHESLYAIKHAMDKKDYPKALELCEQKMEEKGRHFAHCQKLQAELYFRMEEYEKSQNIYEEVLERKFQVWAAIGLAKNFYFQKNYDKAKELLTNVIDTDKRFVEAHDLLADTYDSMEAHADAQKAMEQAGSISSKSVLRQRRLAEMAKKNNDVEVCLKARRALVREASNSCYESPNNYMDLVRDLSEAADPSSAGKEFAKEAFDVLRRTERKYPRDKMAKLQGAALKVSIYARQDKHDEAEKQAELTRALYKDQAGKLGPEAGLDLARAMSDCGNSELAAEVLARLASEHPDNQQLMDKIDSLSSEPVSLQGRRKVTELTKKGISHYERKNYKEAIEIFNYAVSIFPKHVGLNLNLTQVIVAETKAHGQQPKYAGLCRSCLERVQGIDSENAQYSRYEFLMKEVAECYPVSA